MIDLNEEPNDMDIGDPVNSTQQAAQNPELTGDSPTPHIVQNATTPVAKTVETDEQAPAAQESETDGHTLDGTDAAGDTSVTVGNGLTGFGAENDEEAWSQPKEPHLGMRFDTLEGAK